MTINGAKYWNIIEWEIIFKYYQIFNFIHYRMRTQKEVCEKTCSCTKGNNIVYRLLNFLIKYFFLHAYFILMFVLFLFLNINLIKCVFILRQRRWIDLNWSSKQIGISSINIHYYKNIIFIFLLFILKITPITVANEKYWNQKQTKNVCRKSLLHRDMNKNKCSRWSMKSI